MNHSQDPLLHAFTEELIQKHKCHTVILYGSHARGDATATSDYDLMGVRKSGNAYRHAEKRNGTYLDFVIFPEKDLKDGGDRYLYMSDAKVIYDENGFGTSFIKNLKSASKKNKYQPLPDDEIQVRSVWLHKMYERSLVGDIEGNFRRSWLQESLLREYFELRKKRYPGSKEAFRWLKTNDLSTYRLFEMSLKNPLDTKALKKLVERTSQMKL